MANGEWTEENKDERKETSLVLLKATRKIVALTGMVLLDLVRMVVIKLHFEDRAKICW